MENNESKQFILIETDAIKQINQKLDEVLKIVFINKANDLSNKWLNNKEVKEQLGISTRTLQTYRDTGVLSFSQHGKKIYYSRESIEKFMNDHHIKF